jgi:hypothetical protein
MTNRFQVISFLTAALMTVALPVAASDSPSRLSDKAKSFPSDVPPLERTPPVEIGDPFFAPGKLGGGITLPTGAVWQPKLWIYGNLRTAIQTFDRGTPETATEWTNRLTLFGNLQLSGTERLLVSIEPLNLPGRFSGYRFESSDGSGFDEHINGNIVTAFFEGEIGEIFPGLDKNELGAFDIGFSVGRQDIVIQDGFLINDTLDSVGITRNSLRLPGTSNIRITALYAWDEINRDNNSEDSGANLFGLFTTADTDISTISLDLAFVNGGQTAGDGFVAGIDAIQRIGALNTTFRLLGSLAFDAETDAVSDGVLLFSELSLTPHGTNDLAYLNGFLGIDRFSSAARGPDRGGPLGRTGLNFAARGLGRFGSPLSNRADDAVGLAIGYQKFVNRGRSQITIEAGGRADTGGDSFDAVSLAIRGQQALGKRMIAVIDIFGAHQEDRDESYGARLEFTVKF